MNRQEFVRAMAEALQAFLSDTEAFRNAAISATRVSRIGSRGYVRLSPGRYQYVWGAEDVVALYDSAGLRLRMPTLPDDEVRAHQADPHYDLSATLRDLAAQLWAAYEEALEELPPEICPRGPAP